MKVMVVDMKIKLNLSIFLISLCTFIFGWKSVISQSAAFTNPVYNKDFPDPSVIRGGDGFFYAYATQTKYEGSTINIQVAKSKDLVNGEPMGDALPRKPSWVDGTQDFWAPHVLYDRLKQTYFMCYSGESDSEFSGKCRGVATFQDPSGPFTDKVAPY